MAPLGPKSLQIRRLRELRAMGRQPFSTTEAPASKPNSAPVKASAHSKERTMKTKAKAKAPKRSVSEAAANLRAAKVADKSKSKKAAKTNARTKVTEPKQSGVRSGSKLEIVVGLLTRSEGCTTADVLSATGWPSVSLPQQAKAADLTLRKEKDGKVSRYYGAAAA